MPNVAISSFPCSPCSGTPVTIKQVPITLSIVNADQSIDQLISST